MHTLKMQKTKKKVAANEEAIAQLLFEKDTKKEIIAELGKVSETLEKQADKLDRVTIAGLE